MSLQVRDQELENKGKVELLFRRDVVTMNHRSPVCTCPFSVMLEYIALLGLSLCGGSSINISLLCLYLSGREGEPTGVKDG